MRHQILVVDDDVGACDLLGSMLPRLGYAVEVAHDGESALEQLARGEFSAILTDFVMPKMDGLELCRRVKAKQPRLPVVVMTGYLEMPHAVEAIRAGASDFLAKPLEDQAVSACLSRACSRSSLSRSIRTRRVLAGAPGTDLIGDCTPMRRVREMIDHVAPSEASVLLAGETGTGKELVARAIHARSARAGGSFVAVNCAAIPATLLESELFGHVKGAFTDARDDREGLFVQASGGTLFLDEIGELPLDVQPKLLRALQQRTVRAVGSNVERPFDTRILTASHRDLEAEIAQKRFREDLYYRINVVRIDLPPLRARGADILAIARRMLDRMVPDRSLSLSNAVAERLLVHGWPGNVRELENCIERAVTLATGSEVVVEDLPDAVRAGDRALPSGALDSGALVTVDELERRYIQHAITVLNGNKTKVAQTLGLDRRTLYRRLERMAVGPAADGTVSSEPPGNP